MDTITEVLEIQYDVLEDIIAHSEALKPIESCGYLAGRDLHIEKLYKMTNIDNEPDHFTFEPKEQFAAVKDARNLGLNLMAVYHSHPESPARPSEEDMRLLKDPNMIYVIVSLMGPEPDLKAYRIQNENVTLLNLKII